MKRFFLIVILMLFMFVNAQNTKHLPYYELPENSSEFTPGTVAAKQIDALGFRFYWASEGLKTKDLDYKPSEQSRTTLQTIEHIYELSVIILNCTLNKPNNKQKTEFTYIELREKTLKNLMQAANILRTSEDISMFKIIFGSSEIPYWNTINGPISDSIWHCGQLASFRRITGNPINPNVNHFTGKVKL